MGRTVRALAIVVVALAAVAVGCSSSKLPPGPSTTGDLTPPPCPGAFPISLTVTGRAPGELPYLKQVAACTRAKQDAVVLVNDSPVAWTVSANGRDVVQLTDDLEATSYRTAVVPPWPSTVLAPNTSVRVDAPPASIEWALSPELTAAWLVHDRLAEQVKIYGIAQYDELLMVNPSLRRQAMVTCSIAAYDAAGKGAKALNGASPTKQLLHAIGVGGRSTECAHAWRQADIEELRRFAATATWGGDVEQLAKDSRLRASNDALLLSVRRLGAVSVQLTTP